MKLYSAWYCPFAQRVWMALIYKQIKFEYVEIDPYQETAEWLELSKGTGQVPVIVVNEENIVDSTIILNQLDGMFPGTPSLFSTNADKKAEQVHWIDHINNNIVPYLYRYLKAYVEGKERDESEQKLLTGLSVFSKAIDREGPYFSGKDVSVVDFSFIPFAYRINLLLGHYRDLKLPVAGENWERYHQWYETMLERPEFKVTSIDLPDYAQRLIDVYYPYSQGEGQLDVTNTSSD